MMKVLWFLFVVFLIVLVFRLFNIIFFQFDIHRNPLFLVVSMGLPSTIVIGHSLKNIGIKKTINFFLLAAITGMIAEYAGMYTGLVFGGKYSYDDTFLKLWGLPIIVPFMWGVFIYLAMHVSSGLISLISKKMADLKFGRIILIIMDCLILVSIDLLFDPHQVKLGYWKWQNDGAFYGVPWGNFLGWILVGAIVSGIWRYVQKDLPMNWKSSMFWLPIVGYASVCVYLMIMATLFNLSKVIIFAILPITIFSMTIFLSFGRKSFGFIFAKERHQLRK